MPRASSSIALAAVAASLLFASGALAAPTGSKQPPSMELAGAHGTGPWFKQRCVSQLPLTCNLIPTAGSAVSGLVSLTPRYVRKARKAYCRVMVRARVSGLYPKQRHGFHVHTYGDVRALDATSAGGHFSDPTGDTSIPHGLPRDARRHWGDFGNLFANARGVANYRRVDRVVTMESLRGRAIIVHMLRDQGAIAQPTGAAGPRNASCVIGYANPDML